MASRELKRPAGRSGGGPIEKANKINRADAARNPVGKGGPLSVIKSAPAYYASKERQAQRTAAAQVQVERQRAAKAAPKVAPKRAMTAKKR